MLMPALGQDSTRVIETDFLVARRRWACIRPAAEVLRCGRGGCEPVFGTNATDNGSTTGILRTRYRHRQPATTREHVALPAARHHYETLTMQKTVAGACGGTTDVESSRQQPITAIGNIEQHNMIALAEVGGHQNSHVH